MKRVRRRLSDVLVTDVVEHDSVVDAFLALEENFESAEDRVLVNLERAAKLCAAWRQGSGQPGSDVLVDQVRHWAKCLRSELNASHFDRWRIADYAMALQRSWRDLEANERFNKPLAGKRRSTEALAAAQKASAASRRKITMRKYKAAAKIARNRKELALLIKDRNGRPVSLQAVRDFERANNITSTGSSR